MEPNPLVRIHQRALERTNDVKKKERLQLALRYFDMTEILEANKDEWYFGKDDETYEGEFKFSS